MQWVMGGEGGVLKCKRQYIKHNPEALNVVITQVHHRTILEIAVLFLSTLGL